MKKAKDKFDDLVELIRKDEKVSFGQMEEVFAQAFLSRFLKRLSSDQERSKANQFYREHLVEDDEERYEDEEQPGLTSDKQIHYELEVARSVMGTLGVRPSTEDLFHYIEHAVGGRDWKLLDKVLSLTQEGSMGKGVIEKVALEDLVRGRESSYSELREHFGDLRFSADMVLPLYEQAAKERNFKGIEKIRNETHFPVPDGMCQATYESLLENFSERTISQLVALRQTAGVSPNRTEIVRNNLLKVFSNVDLTPEAIDSLDELFGIYSQKANSPLFQRAALDRGHFRTFEHLYSKSEGKIAEIRLKEKYKEWDKKGDSKQIFHILEVTGVQPTREILNKGYNDFFVRKRYDVIRRVAEKTGRKPQLDEDKIQQAVEEQINGHYDFGLRAGMNTRDLLNVLQISQNGINSDIVQRYAVTYMERKSRDKGFRVRDIYEEVKDFCSTYKLPVPSEATSKMLEGMVTELTKLVAEAERSDGVHSVYTNPLRPIHGENLSYFKKFRGRVRELVREYTKTIAGAKKDNPNVQIEGTEQISNLYRSCLELLIVQCELGENSALDIGRFTKALGVPLTEDITKNAVLSYIGRLADCGYDKERGSGIRGVLDKVNELNLGIDLSDKFQEEIASVLANSEDKTGSRLAYFADLTEKNRFSSETQERIWNKRLEILVKGKFEDYDLLTSFVEGREFTTEEKEKIQNGAVAYAVANPHRLEDIDKIAARVGFQLTAAPDELSSMVREYFRLKFYNNRPTEVSSRFHADLNQEQIRERYNYLLCDDVARGNTKLSVEAVKELQKNTGIPADEQILKQFIFQNLSLYTANELSEVFEIDFSQKELDILYQEAFRTGGRTEQEWALRLMKTQDTPPSKPVAEEIIKKIEKMEWSYGYENYSAFVETMTHLYGVKAPDEMVQRIKSEAFRQPGYRNCDLIARLHTLHELYNRADIVSEEEAKQAVELIDGEFTAHAANRQCTNTQNIAYVYRKAGKQDQANKHATQLFERIGPDLNHYNLGFFEAYSYCAITGARPNIRPDKLMALKDTLGKSSAWYMFKKEQFAQFKDMVEQWLQSPSPEIAEETEPSRIEILTPTMGLVEGVRPAIYDGLSAIEKSVVRDIAGNDLYDADHNLVARHAVASAYLYQIVFDVVKSQESYNRLFEDDKRTAQQQAQRTFGHGDLVQSVLSRDNLSDVTSDEFNILFNLRRQGIYVPLREIADEVSTTAKGVKRSLVERQRIMLAHLLSPDKDERLSYCLSTSPEVLRMESKVGSRQIAINLGYLLNGGQ